MILGSHKKSNRGFTLIEMLAVVGIIGILASVTFSSLSNARTNARDKGIQASMQGVLVEASLYRARTSAYTGFCADSAFTTLSTKINNDNGAYAAPTCTVTSATVFAVRVRLNSGAWYCVDSTKFFGNDTGAFVGGLCRQ